MSYTDLIKQSIEAAERGESRLTKEVLELDGMSSNKTRTSLIILLPLPLGT